MTPILYGLFGFLAFMFPVALYFLGLAVLNSRRHPTMISGPWDFAGVLFATSGFLLLGGPWVLTGLHTQWRNALIQGRFQALRGQSGEWWFFWIFIWALYFVAILGGAAFLLWRRRGVTVVYNAEPPLLEEALARSLDRLGLEGALVANRLYIGFRSDKTDTPAPTRSETAAAGSYDPTVVSANGGPEPAVRPPGLSATAALDLGRTALVELEPFAAVHHVTLRWRDGDPSVRHDVEAELAKVLLETESTHNPATGWFLTVASCLFLLMLVGLALLILIESKRG